MRLFFLLLVFFSVAAEARFTVEVLPQIHNLGRASDVSTMHRIASSQFRILKYLANTPGGTLFVEGLTEPLQAYSIGAFRAARISSRFAGGLPETFGELTEEQIELLYDYNRGQIALILGFVDQVLPAESYELHKQSGMALSSSEGLRSGMPLEVVLKQESEVKRALFDRREQFAVDAIKAHLSKAQGPLYLQYGALHDFEKYSDKTLEFKRVPIDSSECREALGPID